MGSINNNNNWISPPFPYNSTLPTNNLQSSEFHHHLPLALFNGKSEQNQVWNLTNSQGGNQDTNEEGFLGVERARNITPYPLTFNATHQLELQHDQERTANVGFLGVERARNITPYPSTFNATHHLELQHDQERTANVGFLGVERARNITPYPSNFNATHQLELQHDQERTANVGFLGVERARKITHYPSTFNTTHQLELQHDHERTADVGFLGVERTRNITPYPSTFNATHQLELQHDQERTVNVGFLGVERERNITPYPSTFNMTHQLELQHDQERTANIDFLGVERTRNIKPYPSTFNVNHQLELQHDQERTTNVGFLGAERARNITPYPSTFNTTLQLELQHDQERTANVTNAYHNNTEENVSNYAMTVNNGLNASNGVSDNASNGVSDSENSEIDPILKRSLDTFGQRTSKYRGVTRHRYTGRYEAHLWDNSCRKEGKSRKGIQVYLGGYENEDNAARAYDLAALKYWGPTTATNFPVLDYEKELEEMKHMTRLEFVASLRRRSSGFARGASGYRGVTRHHYHGRWQARIGRIARNGDIYLGTYGTEEEAAEAYDIAAISFKGTNAVTNFDISRYDVKGILEGNNPLLIQESPSFKRLKGSRYTESIKKSIEDMRARGLMNFSNGNSSSYPNSLEDHHQPLLMTLPNHQNSQPSSISSLPLNNYNNIVHDDHHQVQYARQQLLLSQRLSFLRSSLLCPEVSPSLIQVSQGLMGINANSEININGYINTNEGLAGNTNNGVVMAHENLGANSYNAGGVGATVDGGGFVGGNYYMTQHEGQYFGGNFANIDRPSDGSNNITTGGNVGAFYNVGS